MSPVAMAAQPLPARLSRALHGSCTLLALAPLLLAACAPAPLYTPGRMAKGAVTAGEIPRDARGEPVWSAIRPPPGSTPAASGVEGDMSPRPRD